MNDDLKLPPEVTAAIDAYDVEACEEPGVRNLLAARAVLERAIVEALRKAPVAAIRRLTEKLAGDGRGVIRLGRRYTDPPLRFPQVATLEAPRIGLVDVAVQGSQPMPCVDCGAVPEHVYCSPRKPGARCKGCHDKIPRPSDPPEPPRPPAPADLACALRDARGRLGPAGDEAHCHSGICPRAKCVRCSTIDRIDALLARVPAGWLR
jgi:hypothetical protein